MRKPILFTCLLFLSVTCMAKEPETKLNFRLPGYSNAFSDKFVFHLDVFNPGISLEANIYNDVTILAGYQYGALLALNSKEENKRISELNFLPQLYINYRLYYNFKERIINNRETDKFSADYLGVHASRVFETEINHPYFIAGPVWGMQRHLADFIHVNFSIGMGYHFSSYNTSDFNYVGFIVDLHLGFSI